MSAEPRHSLDRAGVALAILALALIATAGVIGLIEPTETRYAEIAREMRASGDWLVPRLNGILHFHKPPLAYWAVATGFGLFGVNEWGARLPVAVASIFTLAFTALAARRRFPAAGVSGALPMWLLGSSLLFVAVGRSLASDPFLAAAVAGFWALAPSGWALALLGAGFLAKGPVVFVPTLLVLLVVAALGRDRRALALFGPARGWLLFAAVALPWYLIVLARTPGLLAYFLGNQIWARFATTEHQRGGPSWYFLAVLVAGALPWTPALGAGIARAWRERAQLEARLLLAWLFVPLVFFSCSGSKLPAYLLPVFPAVALLAARGLEPGGRATRRVTAALLVALAVTGWWIGPGALGRFLGLSPARPAPLPLAAHLGLACLVLAALALLRVHPRRAALLVTVGMIALVAAAARYDSRLGSPRALAAVLLENRAPGEPVVEFARFNAGLPFYLGERVRMLEVPRETGFEAAPDRDAAFVTRDSLPPLVTARGRVWVLGPEHASEALAEGLGLRYQATARGSKTALGALTRP